MGRIAFVLALMPVFLITAACGSEGQQGPSCTLPEMTPDPVDLADGGDLLLWQKATGSIAGTETDAFHMVLDCRPGQGFNVTVQLVGQSDADLELTYDIAGYQFTVDAFGPGVGEGSILQLGSVPVPADLDISIRSTNAQTGTYEIDVVPEPLPQ
jgi:hypothetical protein